MAPRSRSPIHRVLHQHQRLTSSGAAVLLITLAGGATWLGGCQSPAEHREAADRSAEAILEQQQQAALGRSEPLAVEPPQETFRRRLMIDQELLTSGRSSFGLSNMPQPEHWPDVGSAARQRRAYLPDDVNEEADQTVRISLVNALQVAAANSREYQDEKESLFRAALNLDLERFRFDSTYRGLIEGMFQTDQDTHETGVTGTGEIGIERQLESGAELSGRLVLDLVQLLGSERSSSLGLLADGTVTIPLLRGAGRHIVTEPRTQAERDVIYAIYSFERFKRSFAVDVATSYYNVLQQMDQIENAAENYRRLILATRETQAMAEAGRTPEIEVDQAQQDLLRARSRWIGAREAYARQLDQFKLTLGLPADSRVELEPMELDRLAERVGEMLDDDPMEEMQPEDEAEPMSLAAEAPAELPEPDPEAGGPLEINEDRAMRLALANRLDLRTAHSRVYDAQRAVIVAADGLRADLDLTGRASFGERRSLSGARQGNARLNPADGLYSVGLSAELPWSRRAERIGFRTSLLELEQAVRSAQAAEDQVKLQIRNALRSLLQRREEYMIQVQALAVAQRRAEATDMFRRAGEANIRDVLEAEEALIQARNALSEAVIDYRVEELSFQRDLGLLEVDRRGLWEEFEPEPANDEGDDDANA